MVRAILPTRRVLVAAGLLTALIMLPSGALLAQAPPAGQPPSIDAQITQLRQRLHPTPAQQADFNALAAVMREAPPTGRMTAVQSVQAQVQSMQRMEQALEALYGKSSPQQRQVLDQFFGPPSGG